MACVAGCRYRSIEPYLVLGVCFRVKTSSITSLSGPLARILNCRWTIFTP